MPLYSVVSSKDSLTQKGNYSDSHSGRNDGHKITMLFVLIVCDKNHFGICRAGCALAKAVLACVLAP